MSIKLKFVSAVNLEAMSVDRKRVVSSSKEQNNGIIELLVVEV